jgi:hypothetical protein
LVKAVCGQTEFVLFAEQSCIFEGEEEVVAAFDPFDAVDSEESEEVRDHFIELCGVDGGFFQQDACDVLVEVVVTLGQGQFLLHQLLNYPQRLGLAGHVRLLIIDLLESVY